MEIAARTKACSPANDDVTAFFRKVALKKVEVPV
jgi:hypothetical protein